MKKKSNIQKTIGGILFVGLIFFAVVFGTYQIFFDKTEAALFSCKFDFNCKSLGQDCSGNIKCTCHGDAFKVCMLGEHAPIE